MPAWPLKRRPTVLAGVGKDSSHVSPDQSGPRSEPRLVWTHAKLCLLWHQADLDLETEKGGLISVPSAESEPELEPLLQRNFTSSFAQYFGRISYSLCLWHGTIIHVVGVRWLDPATVAWAQTVAETAALRAAGKGPEADELW
ncbi:hypothetical protein LZ30DRAFT_336192 [Colletotrichum cereale]|nr:hypothetical protein LZ30DRAFT_336192 [Colletotrichum cereale]